MKEQVFNISGMSCTSCAARIETAVNDQRGVETATIDFDAKTLNVTYDETMSSNKDIQDTIAAIGYEATTEGTVK